MNKIIDNVKTQTKLYRKSNQKSNSHEADQILVHVVDDGGIIIVHCIIHNICGGGEGGE